MAADTILSPGFADPVGDAQATFRTLLQAMARPGSVADLSACPVPPAPLSPAMASVALMLADHETPIWLGPSLAGTDVREFLRFHTSAPILDEPGQASFLLAAHEDEVPAAGSLNIGTPDYPDRSATLLIGVEAFDAGDAVCLSGPGIKETGEFRARGLGTAFWRRAQENHALYPLGVDIIFCAAQRISALPRSTRIELDDRELDS